MKSYLTGNGELTLGAALHFLREVKSVPYGTFELVKRFQEFVSANSAVARFLESSYLQQMADFTENYRNPAAHAGLLSQAHAEKCREKVLPPNGLLGITH